MLFFWREGGGGGEERHILFLAPSQADGEVIKQLTQAGLLWFSDPFEKSVVYGGYSLVTLPSTINATAK